MTPRNIENIQKMVIPVIGWDFLNKNLTACSTTYIYCTYVDLKIPCGLDEYENDRVEVGLLPIFAMVGP
jgi:hypothetical protein